MLIWRRGDSRRAAGDDVVDRFEELRTFATIVEAGGVNAAAANLGIAKSAISRRLSELEARLDVKLVDRDTRRFGTTNVGQAFYRDCRRILDEVDAAERRLQPSEDSVEDVIVAAERDLANHLLVEPIASFLDRRRGLRVIVQRPDVAVGPAQVFLTTGPAMQGRRVLDTRLLVVASPAYLNEQGEPANPADLPRHHAVSTRSHDGVEWTFRGGSFEAAHVRLVVEDSETATAAVIAGAGLAQLPDYVCRRAIAAGALKRVMRRHEPAAEGVYLATVAEPSAAASALTDHLATELKAAADR